MIKKLRWKFILYAELSIFALLSLILISINAINFGMVASDADTITMNLATHGGNFGDRREPMGPEEFPEGEIPEMTAERGSEGKGPMGPDSPEMRDSVRFFTVKFDASGVGSIDERNFHMNAVSQDEAIEWAKTLIGHEKGWTKTYYRYRCFTITTQPKMQYVSVIDQARELAPSYRILNASIVGSLIGLSISFLVLIWASKGFVAPLEVSDKKQKRFISDASHELKTPLTIISANAELLELQYGENENISAISNQVRRLTTMIRELNDLARIEEEQMLMEQVDLTSLANEVLESYSPTFKSRKYEVVTDIPDGIVLKKNEQAIRHLLGIVMDNAVKYANKRITFRIKQDESRVTIRIANDAANIPDGPMDRVFERFYRSDEARASGIEGNGIGLSIAKALVKQLGGRIYAKGENGRFILKIEL